MNGKARSLPLDQHHTVKPQDKLANDAGPTSGKSDTLPDNVKKTRFAVTKTEPTFNNKDR